MSRAARIVALVALSVVPVILPAQQMASARAGIASPQIALAIPTRPDTVIADSTAPRRSRVKDAMVGGIIGAAVGVVAGSIQAKRDTRNCTGDLCGLAGLDVPVLGAIGLIAGVVIGAVWPTH